jgi:NAD(P)H dehydrogenase (quinone)
VIGVTGARGGVGARVVAELRARELPVVGLARRPGPGDRYAEYDDPGSLREALGGVRTLVFISSDGTAETMRRHHRNIVAAATAASVEHVVYTSILGPALESGFYYAEGHRETEAAIAASGMRRCLARTSIFAEFFAETWVEPADGVLAVPAADGQMALVTRAQTAGALAALAAADAAGVVDVCGPLVTAADVARAAGLRYEPITDAEYRRRIAGEPAWLIEAYATLFDGVRAGHWAGSPQGMSEHEDKGTWAETAREGIAPDESDEDAAFIGREASDDEPATEEGIDPHAGDNADAVRDGGPEVPEGAEPDLKDVGAASREAGKDD